MTFIRRKPLASENLQTLPSNEADHLPDVTAHEKREDNDLEAGAMSAPPPQFPASSFDATQDSGHLSGAPSSRKASQLSIQLTTSAQRTSPPILWQRLKQKFSPHKKYFGLKRRTFFIVLGVAVAMLLALIIGLSVGLSLGRPLQNLPLPANSKEHDGEMTYYDPGLGACGITSSDSDSIAAVSHLVFDAVQKGSNPNSNPLCGKKIRASRYNAREGVQRSVDLTVVDRCVGCDSNDLDVTTSVFDQLADRDSGRVQVSWAWLNVNVTKF